MKRNEGHLNKGNGLCFDDSFTGKGFIDFILFWKESFIVNSDKERAPSELYR